MKKLVLIISIIVLALTVSAQDVTKSFSRVGSNVSYTGDAADTITNADVWTMQFNLAAKNSRQGYHLMVVLDSVSGTPADACVLAGSDDGSTWSTISTVSWAGTTSDTTFYYSDVATGVLWSHLRIAITGTGTQKAKVNKIVGKIGDL